MVTVPMGSVHLPDTGRISHLQPLTADTSQGCTGAIRVESRRFTRRTVTRAWEFQNRLPIILSSTTTASVRLWREDAARESAMVTSSSFAWVVWIALVASGEASVGDRNWLYIDCLDL